MGKYIICLIGIVGLLVVVSCNPFIERADGMRNLSPREAYVRKFYSEKSPFVYWNAAYERALKDSLQIPLPYELNGRFHSPEFYAFGYEFSLEKGRNLFIENRLDLAYGKVFVEIFQKDNSRKPSYTLRLSDSLSSSLPTSYLVEASGTYKVVLQPTMYLDTAFSFQIYDMPAFLFPVQGATNRSIGSFWGDPRDGGKRSHKGVDIFADRGTPVLAVADGFVRYTGERGLGGKQVWLREDLFNHSIYYAHLDSILDRPQKRVKRGDTLGFVGNTGNARYTPPHLHFGIYQRRRGPTDPLAFIQLKKKPNASIRKVASKGKSAGTSNPLREGPGDRFSIRMNMARGDTIDILGKNKNWYHVAIPDQSQGYIHQSLVRVLE